MAKQKCKCGKNLVLDMDKVRGKCHECQRRDGRASQRDSHNLLPAMKLHAVRRLESVEKYILMTAEQHEDTEVLKAA
ncbi:MAG: hypothetical protein ABGZ53_01505 [Fuerstiella sp.]|jgi:hypothetical protein|nr:hypothetical protein [Fuerstiella sp.]